MQSCVGTVLNVVLEVRLLAKFVWREEFLVHHSVSFDMDIVYWHEHKAHKGRWCLKASIR